MVYTYPAGTNNGKISQQTDSVSGEQVKFLYDSLNRLISANTTNQPGWGLGFSYDGFGNRLTQSVTQGSGPSMMTLMYDMTTNRIDTSGYGYDGNGNLASAPGHTYTYDVENRMTQDGTGDLYVYDAANRRVANAMATYSIYFYTPDGRKAGTYQLGTMGNGVISMYTLNTSVYFGGKLIVAEGNTVVTDRLGSVRANLGTGQHTAYYPYGEEEVATTENQEKFATYTRDSSTGLDYAMNRYYASFWGRFMVPDPTMANVDYSASGSWNAYTYANGDPINATDPDGLQTCGQTPVLGGFFNDETYSQVMTGTSGEDMLAQLIWHEDGTIYNSDITKNFQGYFEDQLAIGSAVLNQYEIDNGELAVYRNGVAVCPLGHCLDRSLASIIEAIAVYRKNRKYVHIFNSNGQLVDNVSELSGILKTDVQAAPTVLDQYGVFVNQGCDGVVSSVIAASDALEGLTYAGEPGNFVLLYWNKLPPSQPFYPGYVGVRS
jgi:RHS repeat-associated protein